ncbi:MOSC domain-containing protein [Actinomadura craniellae]|uniref:MOSC domain-containing protein n=1 Tax=Actinomadura craniellae TaxID=2231787 RepID=A0A365GW61_9ACTN|nr:MOSC N-terminal beta barrel domain-containing protein [Actinomadura craniellae]RAY11057.1 MOSC domain-containing protein [Actinomadura craniellae]
MGPLPTITVAELTAYPLKGAAGTSLTAAGLTPAGFRHDREFMLVRPDRRHLSQREVPRLATLEPARDEAKLTVHAPGEVTPLVHEVVDGPPLDVTVHGRPCRGTDQGDEAAGWFSAFLGRPCRLVRFTGTRPTTRRDGTLRFADGYPLSVLSRASLDDLNGRLAEPVPMDRFRPNLVLSGLDPYGEDGITTLRVGTAVIDLVAPCARCIVTTVDQRTGEQTRRDPLRTLARYRTRAFEGGCGVMFGRLAVPRVPGTVAVGDPVDAR